MLLRLSPGPEDALRKNGQGRVRKVHRTINGFNYKFCGVAGQFTLDNTDVPITITRQALRLLGR
jgi:hypothetical protein